MTSLTADKSQPKESWFVYILECADRSLYTGITTDPERRLEEHNHDNKKAARYTRVRRPVDMVWQEACESRAAASKREYQIKQLSRQGKQSLIQSDPFCAALTASIRHVQA